MRFLRGDSDVVARVLSKALPHPIKVAVVKPLDEHQKRLFEVIGRMF
jgi:hypothetical protein